MGRRQIFTPIAEDLKRRIAEGEFTLGQPLPPERDLAEAYEVSRLTLRKALAMLQEEGLLIRERGRGTTVAAGISATARGERPVLLYVGHTEEHLYKDLYLAAGRYARAAGAQLELVEPDELDADDEHAPWRRLLGEAHAVICQVTCAKQLAPLLPPERKAVHVVGILGHEGRFGDRTVVCVAGDRIRAAQLATRRLLTAGHQRIAALSRGDRLADGSPKGPNPTPDGYRMAMLDAGRINDLQYLTVPWGVSDDEGYEAELLALLESCGRSKPTAIVCDMDDRAASVYHVAEELGLSVPDQLSVVGIGDTPWCDALRPGLDSIAYNEDDMARAIVGLALLPTPTESLTLRVEPRYVKRGSVAEREPMSR